MLDSVQDAAGAATAWTPQAIITAAGAGATIVGGVVGAAWKALKWMRTSEVKERQGREQADREERAATMTRIETMTSEGARARDTADQRFVEALGRVVDSHERNTQTLQQQYERISETQAKILERLAVRPDPPQA